MPLTGTPQPELFDGDRTLPVTSILDGVPVNIVQRVMGHEQASTTLNRYTHTPDGYDQRVLAAFGTPADFSPTLEDHPGEAEGEDEGQGSP